MKLNLTPVLSKIAGPALRVRTHSPALLFGAGIVGVVTTAVLASRATLNLDEVLKKHEGAIDRANLAAEVDEEIAKNIQKDKAIIYTRTILTVAKMYGPAVIVGIASISMLTGAHLVLTRRNAALTAAYGALDQTFRAYRKRVSDEYGKDKDEELYFGTKQAERMVEQPDGAFKVKKSKVLAGPSGYAVIFDESNQNWQRERMLNQMFVQCQQNFANDRLRAKGFLLLNDVYDMLGCERTEAGCVVGWLSKDLGGIDGYVDFGVFSGDEFSAKRFVDGDERSVILDFNVDGPIHKRLPKQSKSK